MICVQQSRHRKLTGVFSKYSHFLCSKFSPIFKKNSAGIKAKRRSFIQLKLYKENFDCSTIDCLKNSCESYFYCTCFCTVMSRLSYVSFEKESMKKCFERISSMFFIIS